MLGGKIKQGLPRGLYGRAALILIVPVVVLQLVVSAVILQRHFEGVTRQMTASVAAELRLIHDVLGEGGRGAARAVAGPLGVRLGDATGPRAGVDRVWWDLSGRAVVATLRETVPAVDAIDLRRNDRQVFVTMDGPAGPVELAFPRSRVSASNPHQLLVWTIAMGLLMTAIAYVFLRNQLRPITRLARVASEFGKGRTLPYRLAGAAEVRAAGQAFLNMRARIERQIEQRTLMLSGVSHDLRTPITRMRLELGMMQAAPEEVAALARDIDEMETLLDGFLDFARGTAGDAPVPTDPADLLSAVVEDARRAGREVALYLPDAPCRPVPMRPQAVRRALMNLVSNALRYGRRAEARLVVGPDTVTVRIEDDGPGIAPEDRGRAVRPFVRLDAARNQDRGSGVGLGLAIAQDVARSHGGSLQLSRSARLGGLAVAFVVPR